MIVDHLRDPARAFPAHPNPGAVTAMRIWHCKYRSLADIASLHSLETVLVATWPDPTLQPLAGLGDLQYLSLLHLPGITDRAPLASMNALRTLRLSTLPSWDASHMKTVVNSLRPLAELPALSHLELFGVVPEDGSLHALEGAPTLSSVCVHQYRKTESRRFYEQTRLSDAFAPAPGVRDWH